MSSDRRFYDDSANRRADVLGFDVVEQEARQAAQTHFDLSRPEDRARAFHAYLIEQVGGLKNYCAIYGFNSDVVDECVFHGKSFDEIAQTSDYMRGEVELTRRQYSKYEAEFSEIAANSHVFAQINVAGVKHGK